jgi:RNA polymerase-interacting CarD/CdnL/TRCF family regulator
MGAFDAYSKGDWIVHRYYGVGQIKKIEGKNISGEENEYYRIETADSTYWMPVDQMEKDNDLIRPISTSAEIEEAIAILRRQPREMDSNHAARKSRIKRVQVKNSPAAVARLIRDLRARKRAKGTLNQAERSAFGRLKQRLAEEWAITTGINTEKAERRIDNLLSRHLTAAGK